MKKIKIKIQVQRIDHNGCHLLVAAQLNRKKARMIIDTGASQSVFDKNRIGKFLGHENFKSLTALSTGLGTNSMESHTVNLPEFKLGQLTFQDEHVVLLDLSHVNQSFEALGIKPVDGIIGGDILRKFKAVIDYGKKELSLQILNIRHRKKIKRKSIKKNKS
jgi:hypothetical protein